MNMEYKRLGDIATYVNGYAFKPSDWSDAGLPIIRIQDLTGTSYQTNKYNGNYYSKYEIKNGEVLISWSASLGVYVWSGTTALLNQHIFKVVFDKVEVDKDFFVHQVASVLRKATSEVHGATMKHLTKPVFDALPFYLPSIEKQKEISAVLNNIVGIINNRKQQLQQLDELVKARFVEMFGDPTDIRLSRVPLIEYVENTKYGTSQPPKFDENGCFKFIRATNIKSGHINEKDMLFISKEESEKIGKCKLNGGEIIIVRSGANTGDTCVITDEYKGQYAGYDIIVTLKTDKLNPVFLNELINIPQYMKTVVKPLTARSAQPHLNTQQVQSLPILVVDIDKQNEFAAFVEQVDKSKVAVQKALNEAQTLFDSLMQEYFG